jgi:hypothetical protein
LCILDQEKSGNPAHAAGNFEMTKLIRLYCLQLSLFPVRPSLL